MDITAYLITNLLNGLIGIILLILGYILFDKMTPGWDFNEIFNNPNVSGAAIVVGVYLYSLALVISRAAY